MERDMQPQSLKITIKLKSEENVGSSSTTADQLSNVGRLSSEENTSNLPGSPTTNSQDQIDDSSARASENNSRKDEENRLENYQMVLYDPSVNDSGETRDPLGHQPPPPGEHPCANLAPKVSPTIGAFTVQCANCFKWRLIPTEAKYEQIREHISEQPFFCETGREWRPELCCDDPPDITQDGSRLWAIDKPNIAKAPRGWRRLLRFRGEGSTKFADVYYVAPSGKRFRSMVEVERYLTENPRYIEEGVKLSQFSFQTPRPLQENYVRKRPARSTNVNDTTTSDHGMPLMPGSVHPSEGLKLQRFECRSILSKAAGGVIFNGLASPSEYSLFVPHELELLAPAVFSLKGTARPLPCVSPDMQKDLQFSTDYPDLDLESQSARKTR